MVIVLSVTLLTGFAVISPIAAVTIEANQATVSATQLNGTAVLSGTQYVGFAGLDGTGDNETVVTSLNRSLRLTGADDSYIEADSAINVTADTDWSLAVGVTINDSARSQRNMSVLAAGDPNVVIAYRNLSGLNERYSVYYVGATYTKVANVTITDPTRPHYVAAVRDGDNLSIYANRTIGETVDLSNSTANTTTDDVPSRHLDGQLDELRTFETALNNSQLIALDNNHITPLANATRTARMTFDDGDPDQVRIFFADAAATVSNGTFKLSFYTGRVLSEQTALSSGQYKFRSDGPQIKPVAGSKYAQAPVLYARFDFKPPGQASRIVGLIGQAFLIGGVGVIVAAGAIVLRTLDQL